MITGAQEKKSTGGLIVFIDLLFLLIAFFVLLLFFLQERHRIAEKEMDALERSLSRITGKEMAIPEALAKLETFVEKYIAEDQLARERERRLAARRRRKTQRTTARLEYVVRPDGRIDHASKTYTLHGFLQDVVAPLRRKNWVAFRARARPATPFGVVVASRRGLLKDATEFDTYWDNVTQFRRRSGNGQ